MRRAVLTITLLVVLLGGLVGTAHAQDPTIGSEWKVIVDGLDGVRGAEWTRVPQGKIVEVVAQGGTDVQVQWTTATGWTVTAWVQKIFFGACLTEVAVAAAFLPPQGCSACIRNRCYCCYYWWGSPVCNWTTVTWN